jgi:hypothetical protein
MKSSLVDKLTFALILAAVLAGVSASLYFTGTFKRLSDAVQGKTGPSITRVRLVSAVVDSAELTAPFGDAIQNVSVNGAIVPAHLSEVTAGETGVLNISFNNAVVELTDFDKTANFVVILTDGQALVIATADFVFSIV